MASASTMDDVEITHSPFLPTFKQPIQIRELSGSKRVIFEINPEKFGNSAILDDADDDDPAPGGDEESSPTPVTESDPLRYVAGRKTRPLLESFGISPEMSFESFYDADKMAAMQDVAIAHHEGAVKKGIIRPGNGPSIPDHCKVFVHYVISGEGVDDPFDSTVKRGVPQCIDLREPAVIPGLYAAIRVMKIRELARVWIRHDLAYGVVGCPPRIAPNLDLQCFVEVLDIIEEDQLKLVTFMNSDERAALDFSEIYAAAKELRCGGNGDYQNNAFWSALKKYRKAVNILEDYGTKNQEDQDARQELLYTLYMNMGACYLALRRPQQVCISCQMALRSAEGTRQIVGAKLYFRFAEAKLMLGHPKGALDLNKEALRRAPTDSLILEQKAKILAELEQERLALKMTYSKIGEAFCSSSSSTVESSTSSGLTEQENSKSTAPAGNDKESTEKKIKKAEKEDEEPEQETNGKTSPSLEWEEFDFDGKLSEAAFLEPSTNTRRK